MKINNVNPTISVIIPLYNSSDYIKKCIESVINQTYLNIEIIIVDDFSQDDSILKIKTLKDCRIKIISHKTNKGTAAARNTGIKAARGEFVIFLDSDDYVDSDLVIKCIQEQQKNNVDCVVYNRLKVNDLGNSIEPYVSEWDDKFYGNKIENKCINNDETETLIGWDVVPTNKFISLKYLKQNKIYFLEEHRYFEDHYFCAKLYLSKVRFSYIDEKLYYYRKRSSIINKSITQLNSLDVIIYKSRVFRDVCFLIESVDNKYKNIFYHAYFKSYKRAIAPMINSKKYQKEAYKNLQRAFQGIKELEIVKNMQNISDLDLALLIDHYDYEEYLNKFGNIFGYSLSDIKDTIPKIFHNRLEGWIKPELLHSKKKFMALDWYLVGFYF